MSPGTRWLLFVSEDCELCDRAVAILAAARLPDFESIGIEGDADLEQRYGERVPVLRDQREDRDLGWPFEVADVVAFIGSAAMRN